MGMRRGWEGGARLAHMDSAESWWWARVVGMYGEDRHWLLCCLKTNFSLEFPIKSITVICLLT